MSFILDALRKADAERARGALPDLHTQPVLRAFDHRAPRPPWLAIGAAAVLLAVAVAAGTGWLMTRRDTDRPTSAVTVAAPAAAPVASAAVPALAVAPPPPIGHRPVAAPPPPPPPPVAARRALATLAAPSAAPPSRVYALSELPEPIRRDLPALAVGGAMHSDNPASRMLILNGQVFHEHDVIAPNLTLVQIQLKSALLDFRSYRYRITY